VEAVLAAAVHVVQLNACCYQLNRAAIKHVVLMLVVDVPVWDALTAPYHCEAAHAFTVLMLLLCATCWCTIYASQTHKLQVMRQSQRIVEFKFPVAQLPAQVSVLLQPSLQ
jgi:hypothetical protein